MDCEITTKGHFIGGATMSKALDPDHRPLTDADLTRMTRTPQVKIIGRALKLTQEEFAAQFHIPIGTLHDLEQDRNAPDTAAQAYLRLIAKDPDAVRRALGSLTAA